MARTPAAARKRDAMQDEFGPSSYVGRYLQALRKVNPAGADSLEADIVDVFSTEKGMRVMTMLEKAVLLVGTPEGISDCALREWHGARNLILEMRRLLAHGRK